MANTDVFAQKVNGDGDLKWNADGAQVSSKTDDQKPANILVDKYGGIDVLFISSVAPYLQRLNGITGQRQLGDSGICVAPFLNRLDDVYASMAVNDSGNIFISNTFFGIG